MAEALRKSEAFSLVKVDKVTPVSRQSRSGFQPLLLALSLAVDLWSKPVGGASLHDQQAGHYYPNSLNTTCIMPVTPFPIRIFS